MLVAAMACASLPTAALSALAPHLLPDLGIGSGDIGVVVAVATLGGAAASPFAGRWTDRVGGRLALQAVFAIAAMAFVIYSLSPGLAGVLAGAVVAAFAVSVTNPATNKSVAEHLPAGRRATVTGLKQSGVHVGTVVGGAATPAAAALLGWRPTLALVAGVMLVFAAVTVRTVPPPAAPVTEAVDLDASARGDELVLSIYSGLIGFTNAALLFVPLYAVESLDVGPGWGGAALAIAGLAAIAGRLLWPRYVEHSGRYAVALVGVAAIGALAYALVLLADQWGGWAMLALATCVAGATTSSANSLVMLAVMQRAGERRAGAASGTVMVGFFLGFGLGAPIHGRLADSGVGFSAVWWLAVAAAAMAAIVAAFSRGSSRGVSG